MLITTATHSLDPGLWVVNYADDLFHFACSRINDEDAARDLVQDTFLAALERIHQFEGRSSEKTWLTAILKNKIVDWYRKKSAGFLQNLAPGEYNDDFFEADGHWRTGHAPHSFDIESYDVAVSKELSAILQQCIQKLPALWFSVFTMKHIDEESTEVICKTLKVTASNLWVIMHRAKVNLRSCLQKNWN